MESKRLPITLSILWEKQRGALKFVVDEESDMNACGRWRVFSFCAGHSHQPPPPTSGWRGVFELKSCMPNSCRAHASLLVEASSSYLTDFSLC